METLSLNRDSWHYKLASKFGWEEEIHKRVWKEEHGGYWERIYVKNDFCSYVRTLLLGGILSLVVGIVLLTLLIFFLIGQIQAAYYVYMVLICGINIKPLEFVSIGFVFDFFVTVIGLSVLTKKGFLTIFALPEWLKIVSKWLFGWIPKVHIPDCEEIPLCDDTRRFFIAAYHTFHDKVCFKLEFRNKEEQQSD